MFPHELVDFIKENFPVQFSEISAAMDLLIESLNEAEEAISVKSNEFLKRKKFSDSISHVKKAEQFHQLSERIQGYTDVLELDEMPLVSEDETLNDIEKEFPNYSEYEVDNTVVHTLHESYVHKRPHAFELNGQKTYVTEWKRMLVETCNVLVGIDASLIAGFSDNPKFAGRKLPYFTIDNPESMRSPRKIEGIEMYVETNFSANFIRNLIIKMLNQYKIPLSEYKIYLRADYTKLHEGSEQKQADVDKEPTSVIDNKQKLERKGPPIDITENCIQHIGYHLKKNLNKHSKAIYRTPDNRTTIVCLTSSRREVGRYIEYWFGLRVNQKEALEGSEKQYLALACGSTDQILLIPFADFRKWLGNIHISGGAGGIRHWNIIIMEEHGNFMLRLRGGQQNVNLKKYRA